MLTSMLNNHPELQCFGELFVRNESTIQEAFEGLPKRTQKNFFEYEARAPRWRQFLRSIGRQQNVAWGFKLMNNQHKRVRRYLIQESDCRLIVLKRKNVLAMHASSEIAQLTGQGVLHNNETLKPARAVFSRDKFLWHRDRYESRYQMIEQAIREAGRTSFNTEYEILKGPDGADEQARIIEFLGVTPLKLVPDTVKRGRGAVLDRFENPDDALACIEELGHPEWVND